MASIEELRELLKQNGMDDLPDNEIEMMRDVISQEMPRQPSNEQILGRLVAVDGIPIVDEGRRTKLIDVLVKKFSKVAEPKTGATVRFNLTKENISIPMNESGKSKGFCFVEFPSPAEAETGARLLDGRPLDTKHTFRTILLSSLDKYDNMPETYVPPTEPEIIETEDFQSWLYNKYCYDQYAIYHERNTSIMWNNKQSGELVVERENWTQIYVSWSPKGTYLATVHQQGIALWGGDSWSKVVRFHHPGAQLLDFSPCEKYCVTWSNEIPDNRDDPRTIIIWDVRTGNKLRGFLAGSDQLNWPVFKWSADDKYVARAGDDFITVFETPSMRTVVKGERKTFKIPGLKDFAWSPTDNVIAYWMPEQGHQPARVVLVDVATKETLRSKNLFNVHHAVLHWQKNGDYLCVKVDNQSKSKKMFTSFELFRMREKLIPVDNIEIEDAVQAFAWEPTGNKFVVIYGEPPQANVAIYTMKGGQGNSQVKLLHTAEKKPFNTIFWSPKGTYFVIANLRGMNRCFEFWDAENKKCLNQGEHYMCTGVEWDPTGRYVATSVSAWSQPTEHGYFMWTSQGRLLQRVAVSKMYQFLWRPRPPSVLTKKEIREVRGKVKNYSELFDREDREAVFKVSEGERALREEQLANWNKFLETVAQYRKEEAEIYAALEREHIAEEWTETEEMVETLVETKVVVE